MLGNFRPNVLKILLLKDSRPYKGSAEIAMYKHEKCALLLHARWIKCCKQILPQLLQISRYDWLICHLRLETRQRSSPQCFTQCVLSARALKTISLTQMWSVSVCGLSCYRQRYASSKWWNFVCWLLARQSPPHFGHCDGAYRCR